MVSDLEWDLAQVLHSFAVWPQASSLPSLGSQFLGNCTCGLNGQEVLGCSQPACLWEELKKLNVDTGMETVGGKGPQTAGGGVRLQG